MSEQLDFSSLVIQEVSVVGPDGEHYTLREASGKAATDHRNAIMASTQFGPDGKVTGIKDLASVEAKFVSACLFDSKGKNPPVVLIQSWPARVQKALYEKAKELSELDEISPVKQALEKALDLDDSPCSKQAFFAFIESLQGHDEFKALVRTLGGSSKN